MTLTLADLTDRDSMCLRSAVHEAGHAVAATVLGSRIHAAGLCDGQVTGIFGKTVYDDIPLGVMAQSTYAGPWAEARWLAGGRPTMRDMHAILTTTGHLDDKVLSANGGLTAGARVVPLMERCWPSVVTVARKLLLDGEIHHEDVCDALHLTDGGGPGSFALAVIRSGRAPGTFTPARR